jgi:hypothetical protein
MAHLPVRDVEPGARQLPRHVFDRSSGDEHLLSGLDQAGECVAAARVELGEYVVEDEHRLVAVGPEQVVGGQSQGEGERPRLPVTGEAARR